MAKLLLFCSIKSYFSTIWQLISQICWIMNVKNNLVLFLLLTFWGTLSSKDIYLKYDPACMDRYEYRFNNNTKGNGLISYYLNGENAERIMLEIGVESIKRIKKAPKRMKTCDKIKVNDLLANSINSGKDKVYIVRPVEQYYTISMVHLATFIATSTDGFEMAGSGYHFNYFDNQSNILAKNIASAGSSAQIFFIGTNYRDCFKSYTIKKVPEETCKPYTDLSFIPGIGITEEKTGLTPQEAEQNKLQLVKINNLSLAAYIHKKCTKNASSEVVVEYQSRPETDAQKDPKENVNPPSYEMLFSATNEPISSEYVPISNELIYPYNQPSETFQSKAACKELSYPGVHIIQLNETLYGISRKYGITVRQLRSWNDLQEHTVIKPCASLFVLPPNSVVANNDLSTTERNSAEILYKTTGANTTETTAKTDPATAEILYPKSGVISNNSTGSETITNSDSSPLTERKGDTYTIPGSEIGPGYTNSQSDDPTVIQSRYYWANGKDYHVVQKGETLTYLAKMYGFTVERFRHINNLGSSDLIKVGQLLKTGSCLCPVDSPYNPDVVETTSGNNVPASPIDNTTAKGSNSVKNEAKTLENRPVPVPYNYEAESAIIRTETAAPTISTRNGRKVHTVKENETLASIANKYNISIEVLRKLNNMEKNEVVIPFQKIYLE